jgi:hypothetical protein
MTELAHLLVAVYKGKQAEPKMPIFQVISLVLASYYKMFTIFDPNVFLLHFSMKQSEDVLIIKCIKMPLILFHSFPN